MCICVCEIERSCVYKLQRVCEEERMKVSHGERERGRESVLKRNRVCMYVCEGQCKREREMNVCVSE